MIRRKQPKDEFARLKQLKCFDEVHHKVTTGWPIHQIARYIQEEAQELTDVSLSTIGRLLTNYRKKDGAAGMLQKTLPEAYNEAVSRVSKGLDELEELEKLYRLQISRIKIDHKLETDSKKLLPSLNREIKTAAAMLGSMAQIKMDLGLNKRHLGQLDVEGSVHTEVQLRYGSDTVNKVLNDPESRQRLLAVVKRSAQIADYNEEEEFDVVNQEGEAVDLNTLVSRALGDIEHADCSEEGEGEVISNEGGVAEGVTR
jgi:DNA-binding transcriptional MerR regulator